MQFASIEDAAAEIREGRMIIVVDDEDRENEGDLVCAAEKITPDIVNFMAMHARGLISRVRSGRSRRHSASSSTRLLR